MRTIIDAVAVEIFCTDSSLTKTPRLIVSNAKFKRNRNFTLPAGPLTLAR